MPSLDLTAAYTATGTGGTQFSYGSGFPPPVSSQNARTFGSALGDAFGGAYPSWTFGVVVWLPARQVRPEAAVAQTSSRSGSRSSSLQQLETDIVRQVREAAREVQTATSASRRREAAMQATQQQLDAAATAIRSGSGLELRSAAEPARPRQRAPEQPAGDDLVQPRAHFAERGPEDCTVTRRYDRYVRYDGS